MSLEYGATRHGNFLGFGARDMGSNLIPPLTDFVVCVNFLTLLSFLFIIHNAGEKAHLSEI